MARRTANTERNYEFQAAQICLSAGHRMGVVHGPIGADGEAFPPCAEICARCGHEQAISSCGRCARVAAIYREVR